MLHPILVEACVDSVESAAAAVQGGAHRLELCANLVEGGTTPSTGAIAVARELNVILHVMIRPRGGDFCYTAREFESMRRDAGEARRVGADGVVFGLLAPDGTVEADRTRILIEDARPLRVTVHRAFDVARDPDEALDTLIALGVDRVLTSGQHATVPEGLPAIRSLVERAAGRIGSLPGGGITAENVVAVVRATGVREVHVHAARAFPSPMRFKNSRVVMGSSYAPDEYRRAETAPDQIAAVLHALAATP
jgi:copper homeostasis protein